MKLGQRQLHGSGNVASRRIRMSAAVKMLVGQLMDGEIAFGAERKTYNSLAFSD